MTKYMQKSKTVDRNEDKKYGTQPMTGRRIESKPVDVIRDKRGNNYSSSSLGSPTPSS